MRKDKTNMNYKCKNTQNINYFYINHAKTMYEINFRSCVLVTCANVKIMPRSILGRTGAIMNTLLPDNC